VQDSAKRRGRMSGFNTPADIFRGWKRDLKRKLKRKFKKIDRCDRCGWDMSIDLLVLDCMKNSWCIDKENCTRQWHSKYGA